MASIWSAAAATPTATDRLPADVSAAGVPTRYTVQQLADLATLVGTTHNALGSINANTAINLALGPYVSATIAGALTFTITNPPASPNGCEWTLILTNGGSAVVTWPGSITWAGATAPTLTASGVDVLHFASGNGGTNWYGWMETDYAVGTTAGTVAAGDDSRFTTAASTTVVGHVELATDAEVSTGTDTTRAMTVVGYKDSTPFYADRSADWTLALTDRNKDQWFNNGASALVCTIPLNATVAFAVGDTVPFVRLASGTATIDAATSVTLNGVSGGSCTIQTRYQGALLKKIATDSWIVSGDVSTVA